MTTTISAGQSLLDVCLQVKGSVEALFDLADANGRAITDVLTPGQVLEVPTSSVARPELAGYYAARAYRVNTGNTPAAVPAPRTYDFNRNDFSPLDFV